MSSVVNPFPASGSWETGTELWGGGLIQNGIGANARTGGNVLAALSALTGTRSFVAAVAGTVTLGVYYRNGGVATGTLKYNINGGGDVTVGSSSTNSWVLLQSSFSLGAGQTLNVKLESNTGNAWWDDWSVTQA